MRWEPAPWLVSLPSRCELFWRLLGREGRIRPITGRKTETQHQGSTADPESGRCLRSGTSRGWREWEAGGGGRALLCSHCLVGPRLQLWRLRLGGSGHPARPRSPRELTVCPALSLVSLKPEAYLQGLSSPTGLPQPTCSPSQLRVLLLEQEQ